jgi:hypothetical protein
LLIAGPGPTEVFVLRWRNSLPIILIDFAKARLSCSIFVSPAMRAYWSLHGGDQLMHQLAYDGLIKVVGVL